MMSRHAASTLLTIVLGSTTAGCSSGAELAPRPDQEPAPGQGGDRGSDSGSWSSCEEEGDEACPCEDDADCAAGLECQSGECWPRLGCGDGVQDIDEECDDGPANADGARCKSDCTLQICGDGAVGPEETCDDGNEIDDDGCTNLCTTGGCSDAEVSGGEACDGDGCPQPCACQMSFGDPAQVDQWALTGGWASYGEAPASDLPAVPFTTQGRVLGTDGNRAMPYPGAQAEVSSAISPKFTLPQVLRFRSWHVDEGGKYGNDQKRVLVSTDDGGTWTTLVDCSSGLHDELALCQAEHGPRDQDAWDDIEIDMADHAGLAGSIRFEFEAADDCCDFEQGWFIDDINALECA